MFILSISIKAQPLNDSTSQHQIKFHFGIKAGANFVKPGYLGWEQSFKLSIMGGAFLGILYNQKIGVQTELLISTTHYKSNYMYTNDLGYPIGKEEYRVTYFDIPIIFQYKLTPPKMKLKLLLMVGPQISQIISVINLNEAVKNVAYGNGPNEINFNSGIFAGIAGMEIRYKKIAIGGRYILGFTNTNKFYKRDDISSKNNCLQFYAGFRIR